MALVIAHTFISSVPTHGQTLISPISDLKRKADTRRARTEPKHQQCNRLMPQNRSLLNSTETPSSASTERCKQYLPDPRHV